ncbi:MAG: MerR family transcriptional regulator [Dehalococcoidales bacterium]|nr:MerR family transcriptional regulator [Dehalococcoidales bacterium]
MGKRKTRDEKPVSFTITEVSRIVGARRRRLAYWDKTGVLSPSLEVTTDKGLCRLYSVQDIIDLKILLRLRQSSVSLQRIRASFRFIKKSAESLASSVILTDGKTIYRYQDDDLLVDTLKDGQMVLRITVQDLIAEVQEKVNELSADKNGTA